MEENQNLNGLDFAEFQKALEVVAASPGAARAPKSSRVRWLGGFKLRAFVRNHAFLVDEPPHLTGEDEAPNAVEYVLGAYGACLATGFVLNATREGISIHNLEVVLDSTQDNAFTFLGIAPEDAGHSGLDGITAKLFVQADADEAILQQLWDHTVKTSPVGNSLARSVPITPVLEVVS